jgi:hypothetical protein
LGLEGGKPGRPTQAVNSISMSGIAPKQNVFKFKIVPHKQKSMAKKKTLAGRWAPWPTGPCA